MILVDEELEDLKEKQTNSDLKEYYEKIFYTFIGIKLLLSKFI
jgi:hypothetical protein